MKKIIIKLNKGQYLNEVEPLRTIGILTNTILHKVITGCGATTLEFKYTKRNSIIVMPNQPAIHDKVTEHNLTHPKEEQILGVYQGIEVGDIENYINSEATYKKILTTPEGFMSKVLSVFSNDIDKMLKEYFLLFDECERIVTDVNYRGDIAAPIDWFFTFENKAMVSATTLPFSHPGFADFNHYIVEPQYDYSRDIKVINTNNVIESLEAHLKLTPDGKRFLFVNSTELIYDILDTLSIKEESQAFCADKSVAKLLSKKYKRAHSTLHLKNLSPYNFLTSRYFSALDIKLDYKPDIIMVTDVYTAPHSILDPHTEVIQIAGRFRNGINSLTHITNFRPDLESKSKDESLYYLQGCFDTYNQFVQASSKADHPGVKETLEFFVQNSPVADYYIDNQLNHFMIDNYFHQQRVQGYYQNFENLKVAYEELDKQFNPTFVHEEYILGDADRIKRKSKAVIKEQQWETIRQIEKLSYKPKPGVITLCATNSSSLLGNLRSLYPWLTEAYDLLGMDGLERTGLTAAKINPAKNKAKEIKDLKRLAPLVFADFNEHTQPHDVDIALKMKEYCNQPNISLKPTNSLLLKFFKGGRSTRNGIHVHVLGEKIDIGSLTPFD